MHVLSFVAAVYYGNIMGTAMHHGMLIHFSCSSEITSARCFRVLSLSISKELYHVFLKPWVYKGIHGYIRVYMGIQGYVRVYMSI